MSENKKLKEDHGKLKPEEYNEKQMLAIARAFFKAANKCNEPSYKEMGWTHPLLIPIVVNISFACELFIKALLKINDLSIKREHDLSKLFCSLPETVRNEIIGSDDRDKFTFRLKQNSCLFEDWRYIFENQPRSIDLDFLFAFAEKMSCLIG
ncbi:hypothetical protein QVN85_05685 [Oscillibacter valericigenes]|nr:hypothetical protein [Oscillibacter valericigenes]